MILLYTQEALEKTALEKIKKKFEFLMFGRVKKVIYADDFSNFGVFCPFRCSFSNFTSANLTFYIVRVSSPSR